MLENQPPHSVRMIRLTDASVAAAAPALTLHGPSAAAAGENLIFTAAADAGGVPAISYSWNFGDGVVVEGAKVMHAYTTGGDFNVEVTADGRRRHSREKGAKGTGERHLAYSVPA